MGLDRPRRGRSRGRGTRRRPPSVRGRAKGRRCRARARLSRSSRRAARSRARASRSGAAGGAPRARPRARSAPASRLPEAVERRPVEQVVELLGRAALQRLRGTLCLGPAPERPVAGGQPADDDALAAPVQVDVALRLRASGCSRRPQLPDQPDLLECGGELRAGRPPLDVSSWSSAASTVGRWRRLWKYVRSRARDPAPSRHRGRGARDPGTGRRRARSAPRGRGGACAWIRRGRGAASSSSSESVAAPRSSAISTSRRNTSAVACASGSARWHGCTDTPKK